jgi:hypothetical protein
VTGIPPAPAFDATTTAIVLALLSGLFAGRVAGQLIVVRWAPPWLPPMDQWYSGLLPYPRLLVSQLLILTGMAVAIGGLLSRAAWALGPYPGPGAVLVVVAYVYAGSMVVRYVVRMVRRPDQRWLGGCIPIVFHVILAGWLLVIGAFWRGA